MFWLLSQLGRHIKWGFLCLVAVLGFLNSKSAMAGEATIFKFLSPRLRPQPADIGAAALWGVAATTTALYLIQPFDWLKRTFFEKPKSEEK